MDVQLGKVVELPPRVFITNTVAVNYALAEPFGELVFITADDVNNLTDSMVNRRIMSKIQTILSSFDPKKDYLLISGSPYVSSLCAFVLGVYHREFTVLRWSGRESSYFPLKFSLIKERDYGQVQPIEPVRGIRRTAAAYDQGRSEGAEKSPSRTGYLGRNRQRDHEED